MRGKYAPLHRHLSNLEGREWSTTFREIERIIDADLPDSAHIYREWWANDRTHTQAMAWMTAGWKLASVDLRTESVVFGRVGPSALETNITRRTRARDAISRDNTPVKPPHGSGALTDQSGMPFNLDRLMHGLSQARPLFHSREDFGCSLASHIRKVLPDCQAQLRFPLSVQGKNHYFDIWLETERLGIELIYTTRGLSLDWGNEHFVLREHGGQPPRRYQFLRAVQSIEQAITHGPAKMGYAILLTNQPHYWNPPSKRDVIDAAFRIHHSREIAGELMWSEFAGEGTTRGKEDPINLRGSYSLHWRNYSRLGDGNNQQFRYLAVAVQ